MTELSEKVYQPGDKGYDDARRPFKLTVDQRPARVVMADGYTSGGGLGLLMRAFGYAADSVLAAEVVTADGRLVRADREENPELLWALKGGGGTSAIALMRVPLLSSETTDDDVRTAFSEETYARLRAIKRTYDPDNVFRFTQNIPPAA